MITKPDLEMFHHESGKSIYCWVKKSKIKVTKTNTDGVGLALR